MSRWQKESGTLQLTKAGYNVVMRELRSRFNARQKQLLALANAAYIQLGALKPAQRMDAYATLIKRDSAWSRVARFSAYGQSAVIDYSEFMAIKAELFRGKNGALTKPRALAFATLKNTERSFVITLEDEACLTLDEAACTLRWYVAQNNRSVDRVGETEAYSRYFSFLNSEYSWKKGEGGTFTLHEEDLSDDEDSSGCVSSTSAYYGPLGKAEKAKEDRFLDMRLRAYR